jgi:hypothetical protein
MYYLFPLKRHDVRGNLTHVIGKAGLYCYINRRFGQVKSRDSSVGMVLGYGLDSRGSRVRFPVGAGNISLHHRLQKCSGAHPASYPMGTRGSFSGGKAAGAWS